VERGAAGERGGRSEDSGAEQWIEAERAGGVAVHDFAVDQQPAASFFQRALDPNRGVAVVLVLVMGRENAITRTE